MSQPPIDPNNQPQGDSSHWPDHSPQVSNDDPSARPAHNPQDQRPPGSSPNPHYDSGAEPTTQYPRVSEPYGSPYTSNDSYANNPYGANPYGEHHAPQVPPPAPKKRYTGSTLIAGMVAAALIGGVTAAGTTYLIGPNTGGSAGVQATNQGVVINNPEQATTATAAAAKAAPSVVTIEASGNGSAGSGSGIILDHEGHILTNTHVVTLGGATGDPLLNVRLSDGKVYAATLVGTDPLSDLAVIKVEAENLLPATLGESGILNVGDTAVAIGAPLGLSGTVTDGIISTLNRTISVASAAVPEQPIEGEGGGSEFEFEFPGMPRGQSSSESIYINVIQTDAAINHGNSGGALVNAAGEIIGVNVAIASSGDEDSGSIGVGFAIPIDYAKRISSELIANGRATHGLLGATVEPYAPSSGANRSTAFSTGARIVEVVPDSAAEAAGLVSGDVITGVNGRPIQDSQTLTAAIREVAAGAEAQIDYLRGSTSDTVNVTVGALE